MNLNTSKTVLTDDASKEHDVAWLVREKISINRQLANLADIPETELAAMNDRLAVLQGLLQEAFILGADINKLQIKFSR